MTKKLNVLALSPHADDVEIAMGGTIAKYVSDGHNVTILTAILPKENIDGNVDNFMSKNRMEEQEKAAKILGANLEILNLDPYDFNFNRKYIKLFDQKIKENFFKDYFTLCQNRVFRSAIPLNVPLKSENFKVIFRYLPGTYTKKIPRIWTFQNI